MTYFYICKATLFNAAFNTTMLLSICLSFFYCALFLLLINRAPFFAIEGLSRRNISLIFVLKLIFGVAMIEIYSHFYTVRSTADAFKYYDDAKVIYGALFTHPWDALRIITGIDADALDLFPYYQKMNNWYLADNYTFYNDSRSVIRFNALVFPFAFGRYVVHMIVMCFLSLTGLLALFEAFRTPFSNKSHSLVFAIFLVPSVLFWGSGVLKEGLILFASGFLTYYFFLLLNASFNWKHLAGFTLFFYLLILIKFHILLSLIPGFVLLFWNQKFPAISIYKKAIVAGFCALLFAFVLSQVSLKYSPFRMLAQKQNDFINLANGGFYFEKMDAKRDTFYVEEKNREHIFSANDSIHWKLKPDARYYRWSKGDLIDTLNYTESENISFRLLMHLDSSGSKITLTKLKPELWSILKNIPAALVNTLFRPTIFERNNLLSLFAAVENLLISALLFLVIIFFKRPKPEEQSIFIFCLSFVFILYSIIGLTTPVLGALVRYKIQGLPYLFMIFMLLMDGEKLKSKFPLLNKILPKSI